MFLSAHLYMDTGCYEYFIRDGCLQDDLFRWANHIISIGSAYFGVFFDVATLLSPKEGVVVGCTKPSTEFGMCVGTTWRGRLK